MAWVIGSPSPSPLRGLPLPVGEGSD